MPSAYADPRSYFSLDIQDLVQAQQIFHSDLFERANVVATAVGRYRRRVDKKDKGAKTLHNTLIDRYSWPCVLVFVSKWSDVKEFHSHDREHHMIPPYITLPDRRRVPTCVLLVEEDRSTAPALYSRLNFPTWMMGGGFPVVRRAQQEDRAGSIGCLVTDGANVFALTNRHVTGPAGSVIDTFVNGKRQRIGSAHARQLTKVDLDAAFPGFQVAKGWVSAVTFTNADAGLIEVDDVNEWTAQLFGIGELGELYDLSADTISLDLIGAEVTAFGAASGKLTGEIQGFFYRYKTVGSFGYVSDILIGPRSADEPLTTIPGDSGTIWCLDTKEARGARAPRLQPVAMQWGGHVFGGARRYNVALATSLSTILRSLDVDLISDWNTGHTEYWGKAGHYKVAATACAITGGAAKSIITRNAENISFSDAAISEGSVTPEPKAFVPLADVADLVWRNTRKKDSANHFADMDEKPAKGKFAGKTLLDLTKNGANIDAGVWVEFYKAVGTDTQHMGALPFRVWQMFDAAVASLLAGKVDEWVAAMGLMAHYVGDACQPLHVSSLHHGRPGHPEEERVHSVYETNMLDRFTLDLVQKVNAAVKKLPAPPNVNNGFQAASAVVDLMRRTFKFLPPIEVINAYNEADGRERIPHMWDVLGDRTAECIASGARTLAMLWESAWAMGGGAQLPAAKIKTIDPHKLTALYNDAMFVPSEFLPNMIAMLSKPALPPLPKLPVKKKSVGAGVPARPRRARTRASTQRALTR